MTIQILLTLILIVIGAYSFSVNSHRVLTFFILLGAIFFVWFPDATTVIANAVGVGRGLDLALPLLCLVLLFFIVGLYRSVVALHDKTTKLARHIAITNAAKPFSQDHK